MAAVSRPGPAPLARGPRTRPQDSSRSWPLADRIGYALCWSAGILLCLIAASIVLYMLYRGLQFVSLDLLFSRPESAVDQSKSGGILDPLVGTVAVMVLGTVVAVPLGVAVAVWVTEYGRPRWLARAVESGVEVIAGTPSIVLAIFGLLVFTGQIFAFLSSKNANGEVFGRSFFVTAIMLSLIALPLVVGATREALQAVPGHVREASYALGKTKAATIRRVLLPAARPGIATGAALGMGRIAGDTAIIVVLLGATLQLQPADGPLGAARGTGSTLTSYVYNNSPAGEGNAPDKAYAAAFVLLMIVIGLNFLVDLLGRGRSANAAMARSGLAE